MNKKILSILVGVVLLISSVGLAFATNDAAGRFEDMPDNWSTDALQKAVSNGLLGGYVEGGKQLIKAGNSLTRAEMATIVNRAFAAEKKGSVASVTDIAAGAWYAGEMAKAVKMGTFKLDTKMRPGDGITRQEAFTVLARAFKLGGGDAKALDRFTDKGDIAGWAQDSLAGMAAAGYIQGSAGKLQPKANITRAEFATVMDNLVKQYIDRAEEISEVADGNVIVRVPDVTLKDVTIKGDLVIADGVGEGDVTLDNVKVQGRTVVRGGGVDSIIIKGGSDVGRMIVAKVDGQVRIHVEGGAGVEVIYVDDGSDDVIVEGRMAELEVAGEGVTVYAKDADVSSATVSGDNSKIVVGDGSKVKNGSITGKSSAIVVDEGGSVDKVAVSGSDASVEGEGEVKEVEVKEGGDGASVATPKTKVTVDEGVEGTKAAGDTPVEGGQTATNDDTGTGATVGETTSPGGGTSRPPRPQVSGITIAALVERGEGWIDNYRYGFMLPFFYNETVRVILGTNEGEAEIYYTLRITKPEGAMKEIGPEKITEDEIELKAQEIFEEIFEDECGKGDKGDYTYGGLVVMEVRAKKDGYIDRTEEFTFAFAAENVDVGTLTKDYYSVGDDLEFTIRGLRPNKKVEVGMPIYIGGGWPWACDELILLNMDEIPEGRYWITEADENEGITVSGEVGPDLTYGHLRITLPWSGHVIDNAIGLLDGKNVSVHVGGAVSVEGEPLVGRTLTTSVQPVGATVEYEWQRAVDWDGNYENIEKATFKEIPGATSSTYEIDGKDLKSLIRVKVTSTEKSDYRWGTSYSYPVGPVVWDATLSQLEFGYYAAGADLLFTISGFEPNEQVKVGMPILMHDGRHDDPPSMIWASGKRVLTTNMEEVEGGLYWIGTTDEDGKLKVSGTVGAGLPYGALHITLPDYEITINNAIKLQDQNGDSVNVGVPTDDAVSQLEFGYYAAGADLLFTISGFEPNEQVKVGMPILMHDGRHEDPPSMIWASGKRVLTTNMEEVEGGLYWIGTTDEDGKLKVSGTVSAGLPYGALHITLPDYEITINNAIKLQDPNGDSVNVGVSD